MDIIRIGDIDLRHLDKDSLAWLKSLEDEQNDWLETFDNDLNDLFVEVAKGDGDRPYSLERQIYSPDEILKDSYIHSFRVVATVVNLPREWIEKMDAFRERAAASTDYKIYWNPVKLIFLVTAF